MGPGEWQQATFEFTDWHSAERSATAHLGPALIAAQADGTLTRWFFIRKRPCWRLRCQPADDPARQRLRRILHELAALGEITGWTAGIYEPEVTAFGGEAGMTAAHDLFCEDSHHILAYLTRPPAPTGAPALGRRELAVLLSSVLMRGAGQEWYEQGDIWAKAAQHRPASHPGGLPAGRLPAVKAAVSRLMTVDTGPGSALVNSGPLAPIAGWSAAFDRAGRTLVGLAQCGTLERGLRAVLAHHLIFFFNRLGLSYAEQSTLTTLAKEVVMADETATPTAVTGATGTGAGGQAGETGPDQRRQALITELRERGAVRSGPVEAALRAVPRHLFVPGVSVEQAYSDDTVFTKRDSAGTSLSAASQPAIVAMMLEQLQAEPGQRILEIGAGTGYNAALLAHLVGDAGEVVSVDVDDDIVAGARSHLAAAGYPQVRVILGDGALGYPDAAPYDRVIATVGAWDLPPAWRDQLAPGGRLIVPLRLRGSVSRSIVFEDAGGHWHAHSSEMCTFMPLRGIADDARRTFPLAEDGTVTLQTHQDQDADPAALAGIFTLPRHDEWTGVLFGGAESFEWLDLWLACTMANALSRMPVEREAVDSGLVSPMFGWGAMATVSKDSLAYLTLRPGGRADDGSSQYEVGVIGHGPRAVDLVGDVARQIQTWARDFRAQTPRIDIQPTGAADPVRGQFTYHTPRNRLVISWD
jgi:protein-L-isoaspartate(D-aspartate) O-methyltransferase